MLGPAPHASNKNNCLSVTYAIPGHDSERLTSSSEVTGFVSRFTLTDGHRPALTCFPLLSIRDSRSGFARNFIRNRGCDSVTVWSVTTDSTPTYGNSRSSTPTGPFIGQRTQRIGTGHREPVRETKLREAVEISVPSVHPTMLIHTALYGHHTNGESPDLLTCCAARRIYLSRVRSLCRSLTLSFIHFSVSAKDVGRRK